MTSDTSFASDGGAYVDPDYVAMSQGIDDEVAAERQVGREPLPRCDHYVFDVEAAQGDITQKKGVPQGALQLRVNLGPEGTKGRVEFARFNLSAPKTKFVDNVEIDLEGKELEDSIRAHRKLL